MGFFGIFSMIGTGVLVGKGLISDAKIKQIPTDTDINAMRKICLKKNLIDTYILGISQRKM